MDRPAAPSRSPELAEGCRNDSLPLLHATVRAGRAASLLLGCLPSGRLAPSPPRSVAAGPRPLAAPNYRLRLPVLRDPLPRRAALPGLQHLRPPGWPRWSVPSLRRADRRQRSAPHGKRRWHAHALTRRPARWNPQLATLAYRAFVPQAWSQPVIRLHQKEVLPELTPRLIGSPDHAIVWGLSVAPDGDFFLALDTRPGDCHLAILACVLPHEPARRR